MTKIIKNVSFMSVAALTVGFFLASSTVEARTQAQDIRTVPENGLNIDWPILNHRQYFTYKGRNARSVTLRTLMAFDCQKIIDLYDEDPQLAFDDLEMIILVQFALRGLDIQTMDPAKREDIALSEISKRLRQFGRLAEVKALFETPRIIPSVTALCHILEEHKTDLLRQKYHVKHQWDLHKTAAGGSAPAAPAPAPAQ